MEKFKIEIKWGVIFSIVSLLWIAFEKQMGWHSEHIDKHMLYTNIFAIIAILIYVFALQDKKKNFFNNTIDWKQGFVSGIMLSFIIIILVPLTQLIVHYYISPDYFTNAITFVTKSGHMTMEDATSYFSLESYIKQSIFGGLSMGIVTAAIVAFFIKTKK